MPLENRRSTTCPTASVMTNGDALTTPSMFRTRASSCSQSRMMSSSPKLSTRKSGLATRIFSRKSVCRPFITPMITTSALTPTITPAMAMTVMNDKSRDPRRLRR